jgi:hypothetical protein
VVFPKRNFTSLSAPSYTKDFSSFNEFLKGKLSSFLLLLIFDAYESFESKNAPL